MLCNLPLPVKHPARAPGAPPALDPELLKPNNALKSGQGLSPNPRRAAPGKEHVLSADFVGLSSISSYYFDTVCLLLPKMTAPYIDTAQYIYSSLAQSLGHGI